MNAVEITATVVGIFFVIGVTVGIAGVIALSALRAGRGDEGRSRPGELAQPRGREFRDGREEPDDRDDRPRWYDQG